MRWAEHGNQRLIYVDECFFSRQVLQKKAWAQEYDNIEVNKDMTEVKCYKAVMAISKKFGLESCRVTDTAIDSAFYCSIFPDLEDYSTGFRLLGDQFVVHWSKFT